MCQQLSQISGKFVWLLKFHQKTYQSDYRIGSLQKVAVNLSQGDYGIKTQFFHDSRIRLFQLDWMNEDYDNEKHGLERSNKFQDMCLNMKIFPKFRIWVIAPFI